MKIITGATGTAHITSDDDRQYNMSFYNGDYVLPNGNKLAATLVNNNLITLADGDICMQGCFARINANTTEDVTIDTGAVGKKRIDLIIARYRLDTDTGFESVNIEVVKGSETTGTPVAPVINDNTSLRNGATIHDMALYEIKLDGINIESITPKFNQTEPIWSKVQENTQAIESFNSRFELLTATLAAGSTSVVINNSRINANSVIDPYFYVADGTAIEPISYNTIKVENGKVTMEFDALESNLQVGIRVI